MMRQMIHTENAPAAVGPYSQAVLDGQVLYASGQIPVNPVTGEVIVEDIRAAAVQVMENAGAVLEAAGLDY
ncbi:MAG: Rid family hydrolase, partial [Catenibacillus sp.]|nr:Rid family hydrolase [Catenibacillus sp.]